MQSTDAVGRLLELVLLFTGFILFVSSDHQLAGKHSPWPRPPSAWTSAWDCELAPRLPRRVGGVRVASWNVRWFPDGTFRDEAHPDRASDVQWLSCAIASLSVDVVAIQEFKKHARAQRATAELLAALDLRTGGRWRVVLDACPHANQPHIGFLFDASRVGASGFTTLPALNPHGEPCAGAQHPGLAGRFRFAGGSDVTLVVVHTKSGWDNEDRQLRAHTFEALGRAYRALGDDPGDVVFLGDFNTEGCPHCDPAITPQQELHELAQIAARADPPLRLLPASLPCSYAGDEGFRLLDHALAPFHMQAAARSRVEVHGICRELRCTGDATQSGAHAVLSDHCPLVVTLEAR